MKTLEEFQENLAESIFGTTKEVAHKEGKCIKCKEPALPKCYSDAGRKEYKISGLCEKCFDEITGE